MRASIGLIGLLTVLLGSLYLWVSVNPPLRVFNVEEEELNPFSPNAIATTFIFVAVECPISNRYAPEIKKLANIYSPLGINFHLVYVKSGIKVKDIEEHINYFFSSMFSVLLDPYHDLVRLSEATVTPQAAIFDNQRNLVYSGRIDDRYIDYGKQRSIVENTDLKNALRSVLSNKPPSQKRTTVVGCYIEDLRK